MSEYRYYEFAAVDRPLTPEHQGDLDGRIETIDGRPRFDFSWSGFDENDPVSGRGWLRASGEQAEGRIFIHLGDDSELKAERRT
ncbi:MULTISPECIES: hypothetical protein [Methylococcus]|uniref:Uncharacterized protein n=1 Tax=Methylococcus capsulatus TaxID=414 RepID=A0ABZ2F5A4_METCP|nr:MULTISPECIES: hypothetical protein [Methylococcus]MDF9393643.1 hypothetical protein [Methylococcus capsulatus]